MSVGLREANQRARQTWAYTQQQKIQPQKVAKIEAEAALKGFESQERMATEAAETQRMIAEGQAVTQRQIANLQSQMGTVSGTRYSPWQEQGAQNLFDWGLGTLQQFVPTATGWEQFGGMGAFGQPGNFAQYYGEVGGQPSGYPTVNYQDIALTPDKLTSLVNQAYAGTQAGQGLYGAGGRALRETAPMGTTGQLGLPQSLAEQDRFARAQQANMYTTLQGMAPQINQEAFKTVLAAKQAEDASELARRGLTVSHMGNLMSLYGNLWGNREQWMPGLVTALSSMIQPQPWSYSGRMGEAGRSMLLEAGLHPNQSQLLAAGITPTARYQQLPELQYYDPSQLQPMAAPG